MYVGGDDTDQADQLKRIETTLYGYSLAVELHDLDEPGITILSTPARPCDVETAKGSPTRAAGSS